MKPSSGLVSPWLAVVVLVGGGPLPTQAQIVSAPGDANTVVIVDADGHLEHRNVVSVIDRVRAAGFATVGIGAESQ